MELVFTRTNRFQSHLIRFVETLYDKGHGGYSQWSHVACVLTDGNRIIDSMKERGGVTPPRSLESFISAFPNHQIIEVLVPDEKAAEAFLLSQVGKPYDIKAYLGYVTGSDTQDSGAWYCYELVYAALLAGGLDLPVNLNRMTCNRLLSLIAPYTSKTFV